MRSGSSATGNSSFNNLLGTGSNKHVVGLDAVIRLFNSSCPIVVKHYSSSPATALHGFNHWAKYGQTQRLGCFDPAGWFKPGRLG